MVHPVGESYLGRKKFAAAKHHCLNPISTVTQVQIDIHKAQYTGTPDKRESDHFRSKDLNHRTT